MRPRENHYCIIMAGGIGSRFWPLSRTARPKQFIDILGTGKSLIRQTFERFSKILLAGNIFVVTSEEYVDLVKEQIPELDMQNILPEPLRRNTAPCIAYAVYKIREKTEDAAIVIAPSDHLIIQEEEFRKIVLKAMDFVYTKDVLLTIGIPPSRPETGYGYIQIDGGGSKDKKQIFRKVKTFTEKPDLKLARVFCESGEFHWNSGIFFWSMKSILNAFELHMPELSATFSEGKGRYYTPEEKEFIFQTYSGCKNISIDYGVMEKADNVYVLLADFGWSDLGTWGSLYERTVKDKQENALIGKNILAYESAGCFVNAPDNKLVVLQGLNDLIVVESEDALLVCNMKDEQKIRTIVTDVKLQKGDGYV